MQWFPKHRGRIGRALLTLVAGLSAVAVLGLVALIVTTATLLREHRDVNGADAAASIRENPDDFIAAATHMRRALLHLARAIGAYGETVFRVSLLLVIPALLASLLPPDRRLGYAMLLPLVLASLVGMAVAEMGADWAHAVVASHRSPIPHDPSSLQRELQRSFGLFHGFVGIAMVIEALLVGLCSLAAWTSVKTLRLYSQRSTA